MENFVLYDEIGKANGQTIYKARRKGTIKYLAISCAERHKRPFISNHVRFVHVLKHSSILQFYEWYETSNHLWLVMELCTGGSLEQVVKEDGHLPENVVRKFSADIVRGLDYIHSRGVWFNEMKPSRFLLDGNGNVKLFDFSLAHLEQESIEEVLMKFADDDEYLQTSDGYDVEISVFCSPEYISNNLMTPTSDYWGLGCLIYFMFSGSPPFNGDVNLLLESDISESITPPEMPGKKISPQLSSLLQALLVKEPNKRISSTQLVKHEFWQNCLQDLDSSSSLTEVVPTEEIYNTDQLSQEKRTSDGIDEVLPLAPVTENGTEKISNGVTRLELEDKAATESQLCPNPEYPSTPDVLTTSTLLDVPHGESASFLLHATSTANVLPTNEVLASSNEENRSSSTPKATLREHAPSDRMVKSEYFAATETPTTQSAHPGPEGRNKDKLRDSQSSSQDISTEIRADLAAAYPWGDDSPILPSESNLLLAMWNYLRDSMDIKEREIHVRTPAIPATSWRPRPLNDYSRWVRIMPPSRVEDLQEVLTEAKLRAISKDQLGEHIAQVFSLFQKQTSVPLDMGSQRISRPFLNRSTKPSSNLLVYLTWLVASCTANLGRTSFSSSLKQAQLVNQDLLFSLLSELTKQLKSSASCSVDVRTSLCQLCSLLSYRIGILTFQQFTPSDESKLDMWNMFATNLPTCIVSLIDVLREPVGRSGSRLRLAATTALGEALSFAIILLDSVLKLQDGESGSRPLVEIPSSLWQNAVHHLIRCLSSSEESTGLTSSRHSEPYVKTGSHLSKPEPSQLGAGSKITEAHVRLAAARSLDAFVTALIAHCTQNSSQTEKSMSVINVCISSVATPEVVSRVWNDGIMDSGSIRQGISPSQRHQIVQDISLNCSSVLAGLIRLNPSLFTCGLIDRIGPSAFTSLLEPPVGGLACQQTGLVMRLLSMAATGLLLPLSTSRSTSVRPLQQRLGFASSQCHQSNNSTGGTGTPAACRRFLNDQRFMNAVFRYLKSPHALIRSKAYLICSAILTTSPQEGFPAAFDAQLPGYLERDLKLTHTLQDRYFVDQSIGNVTTSERDLAELSSNVYLASCTIYFAKLLVSQLIPLICQQVFSSLGGRISNTSSQRKVARSNSTKSSGRKAPPDSNMTGTNANMGSARGWMPAFACLPGLLSTCPTVRTSLVLKDASDSTTTADATSEQFSFIAFLGRLFDLWASVDPISSAVVAAGVHQSGTLENQYLGIALAITEDLSQQPELVEARRRDLVCLIIPVLARLAIAPRARGETRAICVQIIARLAEQLLGESGYGDSTQSLDACGRPSSYVDRGLKAPADDERPLSADVNLLLNELNSSKFDERTRSFNDISPRITRSGMSQSFHDHLSDSSISKPTRRVSTRPRLPEKRNLPAGLGSAVQAPTSEVLSSLFQIVNKLMIPYADRLIQTPELTTPSAFIRLLTLLLRVSNPTPSLTSCESSTSHHHHHHHPTPDGDCATESNSDGLVTESARSLIQSMEKHGLDVLLIRLLASHLSSPINFDFLSIPAISRSSVLSGACVSLFHLIPLLMQWPAEVKPSRLIIELHLLELTALACVELGEWLLPKTASSTRPTSIDSRQSSAQSARPPRPKRSTPRSPVKLSGRTAKVTSSSTPRKCSTAQSTANLMSICTSLLAALNSLSALLAYVANVVRTALSMRAINNQESEAAAINAEEILVASRPPPALAGWLARFVGLWRPRSNSPNASSGPQSLEDDVYFRLCDTSINCLTHFASLYGGEYSRSALTPSAAASLSLGLLRLSEQDHHGETDTSLSSNSTPNSCQQGARRRVRLILRIIRRLASSDSVCRYRLAAEALEHGTTNLYTTLQFLLQKAQHGTDLSTIKLIKEIISIASPHNSMANGQVSSRELSSPSHKQAVCKSPTSRLSSTAVA